MIGPFAAACTELVDHPRLRELWPEYLVPQHEIIRATVPLTRAAAEQARALPETTRSRSARSYLDEHVDEELHHDEELLDDLELLGVDSGNRARAHALARRRDARRVASTTGSATSTR